MRISDDDIGARPDTLKQRHTLKHTRHATLTNTHTHRERGARVHVGDETLNLTVCRHLSCVLKSVRMQVSICLSAPLLRL